MTPSGGGRSRCVQPPQQLLAQVGSALGRDGSNGSGSDLKPGLESRPSANDGAWLNLNLTSPFLKWGTDNSKVNEGSRRATGIDAWLL